MFKKKQISVSPKSKVYQPKYPSFNDKNPLEYPESRPYPFAHPFIQAMSMAGFTGALMLMPLTGCKVTPPYKTPVLSGNPFPLSAARVPYSPVMFGTGAPSRLEREDVVGFINNIFVSEGLTISKDTLIKKDGLSVIVDAYNKEYDIGYVWMDYFNEGKGMMTPKRGVNKKALNQRQMEKRCVYNIKQEYERYLENTERYLKINSYDGTKRVELKRDLAKELPRLATEEERRNYFYLKQKDGHLANYLERLNKEVSIPDEVKTWKIAIAHRINDPRAALALLLRTSVVSIHLKYGNDELKETIVKELKEITSTKSNKIWRKRNEALIDLLNVLRSPYKLENYYNYQAVVSDVIKKQDWQNRKHSYKRIEEVIDSEQISYKEALEIENASQNGDYFIAPISIRDKRSIYRVQMFDNLRYDNLRFTASTPAERDSIEQLIIQMKAEQKAKNLKKDKKRARNKELLSLLNDAETQVEKDSIQQLLSNIREEDQRDFQEKVKRRTEEGKMKALRLLEVDVRRYIQWAKSQQGY